MQISADLGNGVIAQFEEEGVVCPSKLKKSHCSPQVAWTKLITTRTQAHVKRRNHYTELQTLLTNTLLMT